MTDEPITRADDGLLPCPFCGGEASHEFDVEGPLGSSVTIFCDGCHASAATEYSRKEARDNWNTRVAVTPDLMMVREALEEARLYVEDCFSIADQKTLAKIDACLAALPTPEKEASK